MALAVKSLLVLMFECSDTYLKNLKQNILNQIFVRSINRFLNNQSEKNLVIAIDKSRQTCL